jgi:hypothetical protein
MISTTIENDTILATEDGEVVGKIVFERSVSEMTILHTYAYQRGRGIGSLLMDAAVKYAAEQKLTINPVCWFAAEYLKRQ